jgi:hypothetical protein
MSSFLQGGACNNCPIYETSTPPWDEGSNLKPSQLSHQITWLPQLCSLSPELVQKFLYVVHSFVGTFVTSFDTATYHETFSRNTTPNTARIITQSAPPKSKLKLYFPPLLDREAARNIQWWDPTPSNKSSGRAVWGEILTLDSGLCSIAICSRPFVRVSGA